MVIYSYRNGEDGGKGTMLFKEFKELVKDEAFDDVFTDKKYWDMTVWDLSKELTEDNYDDLLEGYYEGKLGKCFLQYGSLNKKVETFKDIVRSIYNLGISEVSEKCKLGLYNYSIILCDCIANLLDDLSSDIGVYVLPEVRTCMDKALKELAYVYNHENTISLTELISKLSDACLASDVDEGMGYFSLDYETIVNTLAVTIKGNIEDLKGSTFTFIDLDVDEGDNEVYSQRTINCYEYIKHLWETIEKFTGVKID